MTREVCKCTFTQKMVGDGCCVCNPEFYMQLLRDDNIELQEQNQKLQEENEHLKNMLQAHTKEK